MISSPFEFQEQHVLSISWHEFALFVVSLALKSENSRYVIDRTIPNSCNFYYSMQSMRAYQCGFNLRRVYCSLYEKNKNLRIKKAKYLH